MAQLVYIDETGSVGRGARTQPLLTVVAALVDENQVQPLGAAFKKIAWKHLRWLPVDFEFHGAEVWNGMRHWQGKTPTELIAAYEEAITVLDQLSIEISYASIDKARLHARHEGAADDNAYLLALQFLLEKIDVYSTKKILIADEQKEHQLRAIKMVADLQDWGVGEVRGRKLESIIDSMHFVSSRASPGVQLADMVAFALQRKWNERDSHPEARNALNRIVAVIQNHTSTWREPWPASTP
ncbi:DUF3800 domain-containing protein [Couchioplanes azureus]|uniref:DUF3800 domain-containing protein n=1 Tax=Couchioplanes caeruleus TaxID=56438 RepID=UPI0016709EF4|nr:DUF3800 domain-containing protein [Couchioplanes caeruleus]GGQ79594.1 hypothetical protein GCM10010166_57080 [Couchioplanes caeruleus subsp. azureus]